MTLVTRLSLFFLTALALVLLGFSTTLYVIARTYLYRQVDERLDAALNVLVAAAELGPNGIEWEGQERQLDLGLQENGSICWIVSDGRGQSVGRSATAAGEQPFEVLLTYSAGSPAPASIDWEGQSWRLSQRRIEAPVSSRDRRDQEGQRDQKYTLLVIAVGLSQEPVQQTLRTLAWTSTSVSVGLWFLALLVGKRVCRGALTPVSRMASAARQMKADDLTQRLPQPKSGDELEELSRAFNDLLQRLEESFERQRRFTGDASHQLRTPLAALLGQVEVALRRERSPEEYQRVLVLVLERATHLRKIVEMMLFLGRADAEASLPDRETLDLAAWLRVHLESWSKHDRAADIRLEIAANGTLWLLVHPPLLGQLVDNLLENACKYSEAGKAITLRLGIEPGYVFLAVEDQGRGIASEDLAHVFEPFYRSSESSRSGTAGVGLGLAVAQRIARALEGEIFVQSHLGQGSCFRLRLAQSHGTGGVAATICPDDTFPKISDAT